MNNQGFGVASSSSGFGNVDGILGLGPTALSSGSVQGLGQIPTVIDTLKRQNRIPNAVVAASFTPNTKGTTENRGSLALGGVDTSKFKVGSLVYTSKVNSNPYWGAKVNRFTYATSTGTKTLATNPTGIVDTGAFADAKLGLISQAPRYFSCPRPPSSRTWRRSLGRISLKTPDFLWSNARPTPAWATSPSFGTTSRSVRIARDPADARSSFSSRTLSSCRPRWAISSRRRVRSRRASTTLTLQTRTTTSSASSHRRAAPSSRSACSR